MGQEELRVKTAADALKAAWPGPSGHGGVYDGLRAIGVDPLGSADQVQRLRDRVAELEGEHDRASAYYAVVQERDDARAEAQDWREKHGKLEAERGYWRAEANKWRSSAEKIGRELSTCGDWREKYEVAERARDDLRERLHDTRDERDSAVARAETAERKAGLLQTWIDKTNKWQAKYEALLMKSTPSETVLDRARVMVRGFYGKGDERLMADFILRLHSFIKRRPAKRTRLDALVEAGMDEATAKLSCSVFGLNPDEEMEESNG